MKVTIIGSGNMASGFVKQLSKAGHTVQIYARNKGQGAELAERYGARVVEAGEAARADAVILATPYGAAAEALKALGPPQGQIIVDITNPLNGEMRLAIGHDTSGAEEISRAVPGTRVVKAFNTVFAQRLTAGPDLDGGKIPVLIAGDDPAAKQGVAELAESMGFALLDAGGLKNARYLEPLGALNIYFGYAAGLGTAIAPTWLRERDKESASRRGEIP